MRRIRPEGNFRSSFLSCPSCTSLLKTSAIPPIIFALFIALSGSEAQGPQINTLENIVVYNFNGRVEIKLHMASRPSFTVARHDERELVIELQNTSIAQPRYYELKSAYTTRVMATKAEGEPPRVLVTVQLRQAATFSAEVEGERVLNLHLPAREGDTPSIPAAAPPGPEKRLIIDLHNDTLSRIHEREKNLKLFSEPCLSCSLPHLKEGEISGLFFAVWIPTGKGYAHAESMLDLFDDLLARHQDDMAFAGSYADFMKNQQAGKISAFLGIEGGEAIGTDLSKVDHFFRRGVRYMGVLWNNTNAIGDSAREPGTHNGLSTFGRRVIERMNKLGMIVDVSHCSDATMADILALSKDPVISSHHAALALRSHYRNMNDNLIRSLCATGGVIGVIYNTNFITDNKTSNVADVADEIDYIKKIGGLECLALGSDYDGGIRPPIGLTDIGMIGNLTAELRARGYSETDIDKIYALNFIRVLRKVVDQEPPAITGAPAAAGR